MALMLRRSKKRAVNSYTRNYQRKRQPYMGRRLIRESGQRNGSERGTGIGSIMRWVAGVTISCLLLVGLMLGVVRAYEFMTTSDYFAIREIVVTGNSHFDRASVLKTAGLMEGMNSLAVNIAGVERALRKTPWVADVSVKRTLPDRIEIKIDERLPVFWVVRDDGLLYADSKGNLIAPVEPENFLSLPALELDHGGEVLLDKLDAFVEKLRQTSLPLEIGTASWLRLSAARGFEMYLEQYGLIVSVGADNWEANLRHLGLTLTDLARRGEIKTAREVWATEDHVWVRQEQEK